MKMGNSRLLDLFCGAGGAAVGYYRAGFEVIGVDIKPQPHFPFEFVQADALEYCAAHGAEFDAIHASPPCQAYTNARRIRKRGHPDMIGRVRGFLRETGKPYVIENVEGAPLLNPVLLIGTMFGLLTNRPRLFECSFDIPLVLMPPPAPQAKMGRRPRFDGDFVQVVGNFSDVTYARRAMGIDWMTRDELREAIPPAYAEFIGKRLLQHLSGGDS